MKNIFKTHIFAAMIAIAVMVSAGCAKKPDKSQVVAQVNNYQVTIDDFKEGARMTMPCASKEKILQDIIAKELLLEEAQKMNLDKDKKFMKEIENYWKQALTKRIIERKGNEFLAAAKVSDEEIKTEYKRMEQEAGAKLEPYEQVSGQLRDRLRVEKAQGILDSWINDLEKNANIKKYKDILNGIELKKTINQEGGADE
ncbi:MAG: hypothetical protein WCY05_01050 [Candidatus Omnitrophota bacterium]